MERLNDAVDCGLVELSGILTELRIQYELGTPIVVEQGHDCAGRFQDYLAENRKPWE
jgi:hypothetical protein